MTDTRKQEQVSPALAAVDEPTEPFNRIVGFLASSRRARVLRVHPEGNVLVAIFVPREAVLRIQDIPDSYRKVEILVHQSATDTIRWRMKTTVRKH